MSGPTAPLWKFKAQLKDALKALSSEMQPYAVRIRDYVLTDTTLTVHMFAWQE